MIKVVNFVLIRDRKINFKCWSKRLGMTHRLPYRQLRCGMRLMVTIYWLRDFNTSLLLTPVVSIERRNAPAPARIPNNGPVMVFGLAKPETPSLATTSNQRYGLLAANIVNISSWLLNSVWASAEVLKCAFRWNIIYIPHFLVVLR